MREEQPSPEAPTGICGQFPRQDVSGRGRASLDLRDIAAECVRRAVTLPALVRGITSEGFVGGSIVSSL